MIGQRMRSARKKLGLSQSDIAKQVGITQSMYSYMEAGDKVPSIAVAKRVANVLKVSIDYLVRDDENQ